MLYDAHCHALDASLLRGRRGCLAAGDPDEWPALMKAARESGFQLALGLHPWWADRWDEATLRAQLSAVTPDAIGEFGLDGLRGDRDAQRRTTTVQLEIARERELPVVLHCVRAHEELLGLLGKRSFTGLVHAWSGTTDQAQRFVDRGLCIAFGHTLLRSPKVQAAASALPLSALLVESDASEPSDAHLIVAERIAALRGLPLASLHRQLDDNARRVFIGSCEPAPSP